MLVILEIDRNSSERCWGRNWTVNWFEKDWRLKEFSFNKRKYFKVDKCIWNDIFEVLVEINIFLVKIKKNKEVNTSEVVGFLL